MEERKCLFIMSGKPIYVIAAFQQLPSSSAAQRSAGFSAASRQLLGDFSATSRQLLGSLSAAYRQLIGGLSAIGSSRVYHSRGIHAPYASSLTLTTSFSSFQYGRFRSTMLKYKLSRGKYHANSHNYYICLIRGRFVDCSVGWGNSLAEQVLGVVGIQDF